jgi:putative ABC transport system permease protein
MALLFFSFALKNVFRNKWRTTFIIILLIMGILAMIVSVTSGEASKNLVGSLFNQTLLNGTDSNLSSFNFSVPDNSNDSTLESLNGTNYSNNLPNLNGSMMGNMEDMQKGMTESIQSFFFYIDIFLIVLGAIIVMIAMLKAVGERTRELGVLKSIGWSNTRVVGLILSESIFQLLITWIIVLLLIFIASLYFNSLNVETIKTIMANLNVFKILGITFLLSLFVPIIGTLIPLLKAFRIKPSESLRYE